MSQTRPPFTRKDTDDTDNTDDTFDTDDTDNTELPKCTKTCPRKIFQNLRKMLTFERKTCKTSTFQRITLRKNLSAQKKSLLEGLR